MCIFTPALTLVDPVLGTDASHSKEKHTVLSLKHEQLCHSSLCFGKSIIREGKRETSVELKPFVLLCSVEILGLN